MPGRLDNIGNGIVNNVLTGLAQGYSNNDMIGEKLFPIVEVDKIKGEFMKFGKEAFLTFDTARAIRSKAMRKSPDSYSKGDYKLVEYVLEELIDDTEITEATDLLDLKAEISNNISASQSLSMELEQARVATTLGTYPVGNKVTLSDDFYNEAAIDYITEIDKKIDIVRGLIAKKPNTIVLGDKVWNKLKHHPILRNYLLGENSNKQLMAKPSDLGSLLECEVFVGSAVKSADGVNFSQVWDNKIVIAYVAPATPLSRSDRQPSFGYTFRRKGFPYVDEYREEDAKSDVIRHSNQFQVNVIGSEAGYLIDAPIDPNEY